MVNEKLKQLRERVNNLGESLGANIKAATSVYNDTCELMTNIIGLYVKSCPCVDKLVKKTNSELFSVYTVDFDGLDKILESKVKFDSKYHSVKAGVLNFYDGYCTVANHKKIELNSVGIPPYLSDVRKTFSNDGEQAAQYLALTDAMVVVGECLINHLSADDNRLSLGPGKKDILDILKDAFKEWHANEYNKASKI